MYAKLARLALLLADYASLIRSLLPRGMLAPLPFHLTLLNLLKLAATLILN